MQGLLINNLFLNEVTGKILSGRTSFLKKIIITLILMIALTFYGFESLFSLLSRKS
ncbi:MAG: hypothetical protein JXL67_00415 [Calditrichaeota bacterium]|nr:hypothetical protein [Calditrichota bacterium]